MLNHIIYSNIFTSITQKNAIKPKCIQGSFTQLNLHTTYAVVSAPQEIFGQKGLDTWKRKRGRIGWPTLVHISNRFPDGICSVQICSVDGTMYAPPVLFSHTLDSQFKWWWSFESERFRPATRIQHTWWQPFPFRCYLYIPILYDPILMYFKTLWFWYLGEDREEFDGILLDVCGSVWYLGIDWWIIDER